MSTGRELPAHLAERAASIKAKLSAQLPAHTILYRNISHPLDSTTLIPYSALLKPHQLEILNHDAVSLVEALDERKYTAVDVVEAYAISASIAQQATNCLTWYDYPGALERAKELDKELEETGRLVGPLHGVVISIKR
jgi:amidase